MFYFCLDSLQTPNKLFKMIEFHIPNETPKFCRTKNVIAWIGKYWFQIIVTFFLFHLYQNRNIQLIVNEQDSAGLSLVTRTSEFSVVEVPEGNNSQKTVSNSPASVADKPAKKKRNWKPSDFRNLSFILSPGLADKKGVDERIVQEKLNNCRDYVRRFAKAAITEKDKYGIPASIKLAQGLLETNAGDSRLANESNNHFGIKCRRKCRGCTCRNYADDDIYDMFRVFDSAWESYREHSLLLQIDRYKHLKRLGTKDYKNWAIGLKKAGYATDKNYHKKLIRIIEALDLDQFD